MTERELQLARCFTKTNRTEYAIRRLKKIIKEYPLSTYVPEAKRLQKQLKK